MNFFIAKLTFQIGGYTSKGTPQFDEQIRLIMANNKSQAFNKAQTMGIIYEQEHNDSLNSLVRWDFVAVTNLYEIEEPQDGAELYFNIHEPENAVAYIEVAKQKEQKLLGSETPIFAATIAA